MFRTMVPCLVGLLLATPAVSKPTRVSGKLIQTGGVVQLEGAGGGGFTPWALISGYGADHQIGANAHYTQIRLSDFRYESSGARVGINDRVELSFGEQRFYTEAAGMTLGLPSDFKLGQDIVGLKVRVYGDAVYYQDSWKPQIAIGVQHKQAEQGTLLRALGARDDEGTDFYVTATKVALEDRLLWNTTFRLTKANQMGLLGFGGDKHNDMQLQFEGSLAYLPTRRTAVGIEYRMNPDNLRFARQDDYKDIFFALFPSKNLSVTLAYVDLGSIATFAAQEGAYLSVQAGF